MTPHELSFGAPRAYDETATIVSLFEAAAAAGPDRLAIVTGSSAITYRELDERSLELARHLASRGVGAGDLVGILAGRSAETVISVLGVVRSGAAYVPLDPRWPTRRVTQLLGLLGTSCLIVDQAQFSRAQMLRWEIPTLHTVVCPEIKVANSWDAELREELVVDFFDYLSGEPDKLTAAGFNLRRGDQTYTMDDVQAYQAHVEKLVHDHVGPTEAILEIGSGSGLIVEALAPRCHRYVAVDPSPVAVERNQADAAERGQHIEIHALFGHEVAATVEGPFDLIILASTVQFMPSLDYFVSTLWDILGLLRRGGKVLLVDIIDPALENHAGVRVPPALFTRLAENWSSIEQVEIIPRRSSSLPGELSDRFDVVITATGNPTPSGAPEFGSVSTKPAITQSATNAATPPVRPDDVAYAIFTSGSTGPPKAVMVQHRSVVNLIDHMNRRYRVGPNDRLLFVVSFCFDLSVYDMFGVLAAGASVRLADEEETAEPDDLLDILESEPITIWDSAPAALSMIVPFLGNRSPVGRQALRLVFLSGDWIPVSLPDTVRDEFPNASVVAMGGATECTVWSNMFDVEAVDPTWSSVPYGLPMQNSRYYVLDDDLEPVNDGRPGDLYIAGDCVALGYAGEPGRTAEKFLPDPWSPTPGERMYATGDRVRWLDWGQMEFLGRLDDQVKVRGYRVELAEVATALEQCADVLEAVVVASGPEKARRLIGFYVLRSGRSADVTKLRTEMSRTLPVYMLPDRLIEKDALPRTSSGKIDRKHLLAQLTHP